MTKPVRRQGSAVKRPGRKAVAATEPDTSVDMMYGARLAEILVAALNDGDPALREWLQRYLGALGKIAGELTRCHGPDFAAHVLDTVKGALPLAGRSFVSVQAADVLDLPPGEWRH